MRVRVYGTANRMARILYGRWSEGPLPRRAGSYTYRIEQPCRNKKKTGDDNKGPDLATGTLEPGATQGRRAAEWPEWMSPAGLGWKTGKIGRLAALHRTGQTE